MVAQLLWRIVPHASFSSRQADLPGSILTIAPAFAHESMPNEVGILLPTNPGPTRLIEQLIAAPAPRHDLILGLFLASPFINVNVESARLQRAGFRWIGNLPSVVQQDEEFSEQLADVGLGFDRELECLAQFQSEGFRIVVVVADARTATAAAGIDPDVMLVLPRVADFAAGFPSLRQRSTAVQAISEAVRHADWTGPLLGLGEPREADNERLWPTGLDGLVCRPEAEDGG